MCQPAGSVVAFEDIDLGPGSLTGLPSYKATEFGIHSQRQNPTVSWRVIGCPQARFSGDQTSVTDGGRGGSIFPRRLRHGEKHDSLISRKTPRE